MNKINKERVFWRKVSGRTVLHNMETGFSYPLDETGDFIWDFLVEGKSSQEIAEYLAEAYEIDIQLALADVEALLVQFRKEGLVD